MDTQMPGHDTESCATDAAVEDSRASTNEAQTSPPKKKPRGRPFKQGESGNRRGRPKGARNNATLLRETISQFDPKEVIGKLHELASVGNKHALQLYVTQILPLMLAAPAVFRIPKIRTKQDASRAFAILLTQHAKGQMTAKEVQDAMNLVDRCVEKLPQEGGARVDDKAAVEPFRSVPFEPKFTVQQALQDFSAKTKVRCDAATMTDEEVLAEADKLRESAS
jgi:hypothetical protein